MSSLSDKCVRADSLEEAKRIIEKYEIETGTNYSIYHKKSGFCSPDVDIKGHRIMFEVKKSDNQQIFFTGTPFLVLGMEALDCVHGADKSKVQNNKRKDARKASMIYPLS
ncbi:uncharacterized protein LOC130657284 [Hydractinia symbiolongicarpus]|uniref:uncharacterized protein LOC130657284 n=1 Tax=Hydractinia symbiolongicarpus TaxID=13093 RepID=UPI00254B31C2|nr:uncharacterized protein LOC130657284 [Hydractinia symbiolongicarpus]